MKKITSIVAALVLAMTAGYAKEVKIGVILPMSGPVGGYGQYAHEGIEVAHELTPKLKNGDTIKLVLLDNKSEKIESANAASKLVSSYKVTAIIGAMISTNTMALSKIAEDAKVPLVAPAATNPLVTKRRSYTSRVCLNDDFQGAVAASFIYKDLNIKEVVMITDVKNDYSIGISKVFRKSFKKLGGKVIKRIKINQGNTDFKAMLSNVKSLNPKLIFMPVYATEAALIAKQAKQLGIKSKFVGTDGMMSDKIFFEAGKDSVEGFYAINHSSPEAPKTTESAKVFDKAFTAKNGHAAHAFGFLGADAYNVIINAMNKCADSTDSVCVNKNIRSTKDFKGVSGIFSLDNKGNAIKSAVIDIVKNGKASYLKTVNP